jgi:long-chain fatty acid transport protein
VFRPTISKSTVAVALSLLPGVARASNVTEVPDNGSEQMARGGAWLARASDPLATAFNPAGLAGQPSRVTLQSSILFHHTCFSRIKAAGDTSIDPLAGANGAFPRVCNDIAPAFNPQIGGTLAFGDRLGLGFVFIGPSAAGDKTFPDFVETANGQRRPAPQRYMLLRQAGLIAFPTIGVGYEVVSNLRLGLSFGWGFAKILNSAATVALNNDGQTADNDVRATLQAKDYFIPRVTGGALWSVTPNLDLAGFYQWTDALRARGDIGTATGYYGVANARGDSSRVGYGDTMYSDCGTGRAQDAGKCGSGGNATLKMAIPMEAKVGLRYHQPRTMTVPLEGQPAPKTYRRDPLANDLFDAEIDLTWANDSAIDALELRFPGDATGAGRLPVSGVNSEVPPNADQRRDFSDVFGVRIGGDYNVVPDVLALRAGAYFESSAANAQFQHIDFAASQRIGFAFGGTYRVRLSKNPAHTDALEIMIGYGHTFFADQSRVDPHASGLGAVAGAPCPSDASVTGPHTCSDGTTRYRTRWPVNLGTITNSLNAFNVGLAYRF